jgi:hypothetical protein
VKTPPELIVPPVAVQVTAWLKAPVPRTVAEQVDVPVVRIEAGLQITVTDVIVMGTETLTALEPDLLPSCTEVAVTVALPAPDGVKTPPELIVPPVAVQVTAWLKAPVPRTVAEQVDVPVVRIEAGLQITVTDVMVTGTVTVTVAELDLVESCVDVAVIVAVPAAEGVKRPAGVIVPSVADQLTAEL